MAVHIPIRVFCKNARWSSELQQRLHVEAGIEWPTNGATPVPWNTERPYLIIQYSSHTCTSYLYWCTQSEWEVQYTSFPAFSAQAFCKYNWSWRDVVMAAEYNGTLPHGQNTSLSQQP